MLLFLQIVIFVYILISTLISIPFYLSNCQVTFLNSIFESISGLTGTGFSIFKDIKYLDVSVDEAIKTIVSAGIIELNTKQKNNS